MRWYLIKRSLLTCNDQPIFPFMTVMIIIFHSLNNLSLTEKKSLDVDLNLKNRGVSLIYQSRFEKWPPTLVIKVIKGYDLTLHNCPTKAQHCHHLEKNAVANLLKCPYLHLFTQQQVQ